MTPGGLHKLVDDKFGPLFRFQTQRLRSPEPNWWLATTSVARYPIGSWSMSAPVVAAGASPDRDEAILRCLGEGAERYAGLNSMTALETRIGPCGESIHDQFPRCAPQEECWESLKAIDPTENITLTPVKRLDTGASVWVPAGHVHLGFSPSESERPVTLPISTGLAFSPSLPQAIWRGLCEVAERDAIMLSWLTNKPNAALILDSLDCVGAMEIRHRIDALRAAAMRPLLFDISIDFRAPVVLCLLQSDAAPYLTAGASCHEDPAQACCKAIDEAVSVRTALPPARSMDRSAADFLTVDTLEAHAELHAGWQDNPAVDIFGANALQRRPLSEFLHFAFPSPPRNLPELREIARGMASDGLTVLWADLTSSELAELGHVIRILVPEYMPLSQRYSARWLATPRLHRLLCEIGISPVDINAYPHPFA